MDLTKILKVGDRIYSPTFGEGRVTDNNSEHICNFPLIIMFDNFDHSHIFTKEGKYLCDTECTIFPSKENRDWSTYKINKFKPFDKVLVFDGVWKCDFFSHYAKGYTFPYKTTGGYYSQCVPYNEETKYLVGTKLDY